jgi:hypothetical protein
VRRSILIRIGLAGTLALAAGTSAAGTFAPAPLAPDLGLDALTRQVTRTQLGRSLFGDPWATVTLSHVDVYDRFPFVESRHFLVVSDPAWNRLVYGEAGKSLAAFDGAQTAMGARSRRAGSRSMTRTASTWPTAATAACSCSRRAPSSIG